MFLGLPGFGLRRLLKNIIIGHVNICSGKKKIKNEKNKVK